MSEQRFETGSTPHVVVDECAGALVIGSWAGTAVIAQGPQFTTDIADPNQLKLSSHGDLSLTVPEKASVSIKTCTGPLTIKHVDGFINIGTAVQTITLNDVGSTKIDSTSGQLHAENINGPLNVGQAKDINLRNVDDVAIGVAKDDVTVQFAIGSVGVGRADGRINLHTISGPVTIKRANEARLSNLGGWNQVSCIDGELQLIGGLTDGEHSFEAKGDIFVAWPVAAPLTLVAEAMLIDNQLSLANGDTTKLEDGRSQLTGHIEQGKPFVSLKSMGNIGLKPLQSGETATLSAADFDFSVPPPTLAEVVETAVRTTFPDATPAQTEQIITTIEDYLAKSEQTIHLPSPSHGQIAAAKAQQKVEKSLQKAEDSVTQAQTRLTQPPPKPEPIDPEPDTVPEKPPAPETAVTMAVTPSQTQILKLLKDDAITVEQANLLLDNLHNA